MTASSSVLAVQKGLRILAHLNQHNGLSSTELSTLVGIPRSTVFRVLKTLAAAKYVRVDQGHRYRITREARSLSSALPFQSSLAKVAKPIIQTLHQTYYWPVMISSLQDERVLVDVTMDWQCPQIDVRRVVGQEELLPHSASAQVVVAHMPQVSWPTFAERAQAYQLKAKLKSSRVITARLSQVLVLGFSEVCTEPFRDIAVPILSPSHGAALSIRLPAALTQGEYATPKIVAHLSIVAQDIASAWSHQIQKS